MAASPYSARKLHNARNRRVAKYTALVGQIVWASNSLHAVFFELFRYSMMSIIQQGSKLRAIDASKAIWDALRSDDIQRTVLKSLVEATFEKREAKSIIWALDTAGQISAFRNDAVHTPFWLYTSSKAKGIQIGPNSSAGHPSRVSKLDRVGHTKLFKSALGDLVQLRAYAEAIYVKLAFEPANSLPRRPILRSIRLVRQNPPKSNNRQRKKAKPRPRRGSLPG